MSEQITTNWFIANLFHPVLLFLVMHFTFGEKLSSEAILYLLIGFVASLLLSLPCILLNYACVRISFWLFKSAGERIGGWILFQFASTYVYALFLISLFLGLSELIVYRFALPAALAMLLANLIAYKKIEGFVRAGMAGESSDIPTNSSV